jgi:hypothetical protein
MTLSMIRRHSGRHIRHRLAALVVIEALELVAHSGREPDDAALDERQRQAETLRLDLVAQQVADDGLFALEAHIGLAKNERQLAV